MQIDNLHIFSILLFTIIAGGAILLLYRNYILREKLKTIYKLLFDQEKLFYTRYILLICSLIIISLGIFKITYFNSAAVQSDQGLDIVFVLDVSKSMNTLDIQNGSYSRIDYAKFQIASYLTSHPENRYALVIFAGDGISISPLTQNFDAFLTNLSRVNYTNIGKQGTNLIQALELGYTRFGISEGTVGKALILISDGGDSDDILDFNALSKININHIPSFIFGVGSKKGGPIPIGKDNFGKMVFQAYQGKTVYTKINTELLKKLASAIDGNYNNLRDLGNQLDTIRNKAIKKSQDKYKQDISGILSIFAVIFFILYLLFPYLIRGKK